jgi:DNA-binding response OmpR family regulator
MIIIKSWYVNNLKKILLLEDDELLSQTLVQLLQEEKYSVTLVGDGEDALEATYNENFDLYLLDINVPLLNGIDFLKLSRESGDKTPAFFITALRDIDSLSQAFDSGCDDYIKKPFDIDELFIRINSKLKNNNPLLSYKDITFDLLENRIFQNGKEVDFGTVEKAVFALLIRNIAVTVSKSMLFDVMQKPSDTALRVLINKLRKTLNLEITNIKSIGYKLEKL